MQVTREGDYALRAAIYLAVMHPRICSASEVSREQKIPIKFLARIMLKLVKQGVIKSLPGSKGGYRLSRAPKEIAFLTILEAVEGPLLLNSCLDEDFDDCDHEDICSMKLVWKRTQDLVASYLSKVTLDQLTEPPCKQTINT